MSTSRARGFTIIGDASDGAAANTLRSLVRRHNAVRKISIVAPVPKGNDPSKLIGPIGAPLVERECFVGQSSLAALLSPVFLSQRHDAQLTVISYGAEIASSNTFGIYPNGKITISVDKETYQTLGLDGRVNKQVPRGTLMYLVEFHADDLRDGSKLLERVQWCLGDRVGRVTFLASRSTADGARDLPIRFPAGVTSRRAVSCAPPLAVSTCRSVRLPRVAAAAWERSRRGEGPSEPVPRLRGHVTRQARDASDDERLHWRTLFDYAGAAACGLIAAEELDPYVSSMDIVGGLEGPANGGDDAGDDGDDDNDHENTEARGDLALAAAESLFPPAVVQAVCDAARARVDGGEIPWAAIVANGWPDAPSSRGADRVPQEDASCDLVAFFMPEGKFAMLAVSGPGDNFSS